MKRAPAWPLEELIAADRNALTVYSALRWLAGDSRKLGTSRKRIRSAIGLSEKRITTAIHALKDAGWIRLHYGRATHRMWYRISFPKDAFFPVSRKTPARKAPSRDKKASQQSASCRAEKDLHSRKGVGGGPALECGDPAPEPIHEHPSARVERERLAQIRAAREQRSAQSAASTEQYVEITRQNENDESQLHAKK